MRTSGVVERTDRPWWLRVRSAALLALLLTGLGIATAAVIGVLALGLGALLDNALG
jgi:hypothetical protein